jgi:hypothetical protein
MIVDESYINLLCIVRAVGGHCQMNNAAWANCVIGDEVLLLPVTNPFSTTVSRFIEGDDFDQ